MKHEELSAKYARRRPEIAARLMHFEAAGKNGGRALFEELAFCLLTPQSKARSCDQAIRELKSAGLLFEGGARSIADVLSRRTRFHNNKARYLVEARKKFEADGFSLLKRATFSGTERQSREHFLKSVKGLGMKEASHYLRNVGRGGTLAILDRHILKNLAKSKAIGGVPKSMTRKKYLAIEREMEKFCARAGIPLSHLDLLFWAEETGEVFK